MRLSDIQRALHAAGIEDAAKEARLLFAAITNTPAYRLLCTDPSSDDSRLDDAVARRVRREPLAYILGKVSFFRETYTVTPDVLIPRADTEMLVERAIAFLPHGAHFLDFCTGSGCVAISILAARPDCTACAYDISLPALRIAQLNATQNGVADRLTCKQADLCADVVDTRGVAAIVANPPYIGDDAMAHLAPELSYEPRTALNADENGLFFYRRFLSLYHAHAPAIPFLFEIGYDQGPALRDLAAQNGYAARIDRDLGGRDRVAICTPINIED